MVPNIDRKENRQPMQPKQEQLSPLDELDEWLDKLDDVIEMIGSGEMSPKEGELIVKESKRVLSAARN
jgi:hypothetical protein